MDILKYQDYEGSGELDMARRVCRGKILFIDDLLTYESDAPAELQAEFEAAVEDYITTRPSRKKALFALAVGPLGGRNCDTRGATRSSTRNGYIARKKTGA